jgi:hypothetical protein
MGIPRRSWRLAAGVTAAGIAVAIGLAGCGGADDTGSSDGGGAVQRDSAAEAPAPAEGGPAADAPGQGAPGADKDGEVGGAPVRFQVDQRSIIYTGSLTVRVKKAADVDTVAERAIAAATGAGGFVGSDKRTSDGGHTQAALTLRVPANRFTTVVNQLAELGKEESRSIDTQDVTEEVVDLDARLASQQASVNRTRTLLAQARTIAEIVSVEGELAKREAELASLQAKKRRLGDLTALSTITLMLLGPDAAVIEKEDPETGFLAGLAAGWTAFVASLEVLLTVLGALLPWAVALGVPAYLIYRLVRWLNRRRRPPAEVTP